MSEIELKFVLDADGLARIAARLQVLGLADPAAKPRALRSIYHDTEDGRLADAAIALRLRKDGARWLQTAKARAALAGGLSRAEEVEGPAPGGRLDLAALPDPALVAEIAALVGDAPLAPVFETEMTRTSHRVPLPGGGMAELALDEGAILAESRRAPFCEAELELIEGAPAALYALAKDLFDQGGVAFSTLNKAARGRMLARKGRIGPPPEPRPARKVPLRPGQSAETAARDVLRECLAQIAANLHAMHQNEDPEGPHQLRVGLRRLRSAFSAFGPVLAGPARDAVSAEARWLAREVGALRDLDVISTELLAPRIASHPKDFGFNALQAAVDARREEGRAALRAILTGPRTGAFLLDLARFIETRGWLRAEDYGQTERLARPVSTLAATALQKRWKAARKRGKRIDALDVPDRHELRKDLKKLRYAVEFMAPLYPAKAVGPFVRRLRRLQDVFGALNDAAMAEARLTGMEAPAAGDPAAQRAVGWLLGSLATRAEIDWQEAQALWHALNRLGPFWR